MRKNYSDILKKIFQNAIILDAMKPMNNSSPNLGCIYVYMKIYVPWAKMLLLINKIISILCIITEENYR